MADIACAFQDAIVEVLASKVAGRAQANRPDRLVVAGGVGANRQLREQLSAHAAPPEASRCFIRNWNSAPTTAP